jgi:D-glycero-D-manno-heptose 1,7-bisphosphate phosphatase
LTVGSKIRPVVFFDRDGTLNEEVGYIRALEDLQLISGAAAAVRKLNEAHVAVVLVTNQTGAARGYYEEEHIHALNDRLERLLAEDGARLDAVYYCPHLPEATVSQYALRCQCRKPEAGLVTQAFENDLSLDRSRSYVVGDKATDIELAHNCGAVGVLVKTGYGQAVLDGTYQHQVSPDFTCQTIVEAVDWILADLQND